MATLISHSPEQTFAIGEDWGREAAPGWVIGLSGELGAGKTHLVKGLARGLGITARVTSPSFALVNEYRDGRLPLFHLDLYRLDSPEQIIGAGLEPYLNGTEGIAVVEWVERWLGQKNQGPSPNAQCPMLPQPSTRFRHVLIESVSETERRITYEDSCA